MSYRLTLAETEACLRKAARACGLDWGIAEEAGKAARWLAAFDLPGPEKMLSHLQNLAHKDYSGFIPNCDLQPWKASGGLLCPIVSGAALADRSALLLEGRPVKLGRIAWPLLLAPALGMAARHHQTAFTICWAGLRMDCYGDGISIDGNRENLLLPEVASVCCCHEEPSRPQQRASTLAYEIDEKIFRKIDELAFRTYVPASEESRAGAGAGLTDND